MTVWPVEWKMWPFLISGLLFTFERTLATCPSQAALDEGYELHLGKYYRFYNDTRIYFDDARALCHQHGAELPKFETEAEFDHLRAYTQLAQQHIWLGAKRRYMNGPCTGAACDGDVYWLDGGGPIAQQPWFDWQGTANAPCMRLPKEPANYRNVYDWFCKRNWPVVCQLDCGNVYVEPEPECPDIPSGYTKELDGKYYKSVGPPMAFWNAMERCAEDGAEIAGFDSSSQDSFAAVKHKIAEDDYGNPGTFVGMFNPSEETCVSAATCGGKLVNSDGAYFYQQPWMTNFEALSDDAAKVCGTMKYTHFSNPLYHFETQNCVNEYRALCRFDCDAKIEYDAAKKFVEFMGRKYSRETTDVTLSDCEAKGATFPMFRDVYEKNAAFLLLSKSRCQAANPM